MLFCFESKCVVLRFIPEPVGLLNDLELFIKVFFEVSGEKEKYFTRSQAAEAVGGHCCAGALMSVFRSDSQSPLVLMMQSTSVYVSRISSNVVFLWIGIDFIPVDDITLVYAQLHVFVCGSVIWNILLHYKICSSKGLKPLNLPFNSN